MSTECRLTEGFDPTCPKPAGILTTFFEIELSQSERNAMYKDGSYIYTLLDILGFCDTADMIIADSFITDYHKLRVVMKTREIASVTHCGKRPCMWPEEATIGKHISTDLGEFLKAFNSDFQTNG